MIFNLRRRVMVVFILALAAAGLAGGTMIAGAADTGYAPARGSGSGGTIQGKIPFPRPDSHKGNWIEFHGASASLDMNEAGQTGKACLTCHEKNDCISCHNTRMPRDHTNTWRNLSHGMMAEGNRERCLACHRQDYCIRCHNETAPRTHVGNWLQRHCTWCHYASYPVPADGCGVCHRQAVHTSGPVP